MPGQYRTTQSTTKLSTINNKLAMSLDVANIVPWKWDLTSRTILCDINKPIELSTQGKGIAEATGSARYSIFL